MESKRKMWQFTPAETIKWRELAEEGYVPSDELDEDAKDTLIEYKKVAEYV